MPENPQIPLKKLNPSVDASFCDFKTPDDQLNFFVENIVGDGQAIASLFTNDVVYSPTEPVGAQRGKLWVKQTGTVPLGVGILVGGEYVIIPIPRDQEKPQAVPAGTIVVWTGSGSLPEGWGSYPQSAATALGLPTLTGAQYIIKS